jgi:hypothetical protein
LPALHTECLPCAYRFPNMFRLLESVPWIVIVAIAASAVLAIAAGRTAKNGALTAGLPARVSGIIYAAVAGVIIFLWIGEQV